MWTLIPKKTEHMKKIFLFILLVIVSIAPTFGYTVSEWSEVIESVKQELSGTKYSFKDNEWSSGQSSYHIFYEERMVGYIYATDNWISMWSGWKEQWEVGTFFTKKEFEEEDVLKFFYKISTPITWILADNFAVSGEKLSYYVDTKNLRLYFKVDVIKSGNYKLDLSINVDFWNTWSQTLWKSFDLLKHSNEIYYWDFLHWDDWKSTIRSYQIKIYECTKWERNNVCAWRNEIFSKEIKNVNVSTVEDYNIDFETKVQTNKLQSYNKLMANERLKKYGWVINEYVWNSKNMLKLKEVQEKVNRAQSRITNKGSDIDLLLTFIADSVAERIYRWQKIERSLREKYNSNE